MRRAGAAFVFCVAALGVSPSTALAWDTNTRLYAFSSSPYWQVGTADTELSNLCRDNLFNQRSIARLYIQYTGEKGRGITGMAFKGWNLIDPKGKAVAGKTYHFFADGTSQCQVFVAP